MLAVTSGQLVVLFAHLAVWAAVCRDLAVGTVSALPGAGAGRLAGHPRGGPSLPWHGHRRQARMHPGRALAARPWDGNGLSVGGFGLRFWGVDGPTATKAYSPIDRSGRYWRALESPFGL
jgi:hypothetical protein